MMLDDDKALFRALMKGVKPLAKNNQIEPYPTQPPILIKRRQFIQESPAPSYYLRDEGFIPVGAEDILSYCSPHFPQKQFRALKQNKFPLEARLDLHGLDSETAKEKLVTFLIQQTAAEHRSLLIIHGKGGYHGDTPILKNRVAHWLQQMPQVLAFHSALPKNGGTGALYVFLRRNKLNLSP